MTRWLINWHHFHLPNLEEEEKPADLSQKIIFKVKKKKDDAEGEKSNESQSSKGKSAKSSKKEKPTKSLLSFEDEDE